MVRQAVFVGGMHGSGKTSLCARLCRSADYYCVQQRRAVIDVGMAHGFSAWEEIGPRHSEFIIEAADHIVRSFFKNGASVLLVDCHYAIRSAKALRVAGHAKLTRYIHDLDPVLVQRLIGEFRVKFVLQFADPETILLRLHGRPADTLDEDYTLPVLKEQGAVEQDFLLRLITNFRIPKEDILVLVNNGTFNAAAHILREFIERQ